MANEKTPLLAAATNDVILKIPAEKMLDFDINNNSTNEITTSLTYEELLPFIIDPSWIRLRKICSTACWIIFCAILAAACISAFMSMSKECGGMSSMTVTKGDNVSVESEPSTKSMSDAKGILSIMLSPINSTMIT